MVAAGSMYALAPPASSLLGRASELKALGAQLPRAQHTTVVGPPGSGKTALVRAFADRWDGPVIWLDAHAASRGAPAAPAGALVIVDGADTVQAPPPSGEAFSVVTRRVAFGRSDEAIIRLGPLAPVDAAALFRARRAALGGAPLDDPAVAQRCVDWVDALPGAVEWLARRTALRTEAELETEPLPPVERWSLPSLDEALAEILRAMSGLEAMDAALAATAVGRNDIVAARDGLEALHASGLVQRDAAGTPERSWYRVFRAAAQADPAGDRRALAARLASDARAHVAALHGGDAATAKAELNAIEPLLRQLADAAEARPEDRVALRLGLDGAWMDGRPLSEMLDNLDRAIALARGTDLEVEARTACARTALLRGDVDRASAEIAAASARAESRDAPTELWLIASAVARCRGSLTEAAAFNERAAKDAAARSDRAYALRARFSEVKIDLVRSRLDEARRGFADVAAEAEELGMTRILGLSWGCLGLVAKRTDRLDEAIAWHERAVALLADADAVLQHKLTLGLAELRLAAGEPAAASALIDLALRSARRVGDVEALTTTRMLRARIAAETGQLGSAATDARMAEAAARRLGFRWLRDATLVTRRDVVGGEDEPLVVIGDVTELRLGGRRIELGRRPVLRRLVARLVEEHELRPGAGLDVEALGAAGWPGEKMRPQSHAERLYTAIRTLRVLGLRDVLLRDARGYLLDPSMDVLRRAGTDDNELS